MTRRWWPARKHPAAGTVPPRTPRTPPPGPHNPALVTWVVFGSPCGCWTKVDLHTGRQLGNHVCAQAPTWAQWESELRS